jgi:hypothetical protein
MVDWKVVQNRQGTGAQLLAENEREQTENQKEKTKKALNL